MHAARLVKPTGLVRSATVLYFVTDLQSVIIMTTILLIAIMHTTRSIQHVTYRQILLAVVLPYGDFVEDGGVQVTLGFLLNALHQGGTRH